MAIEARAMSRQNIFDLETNGFFTFFTLGLAVLAFCTEGGGDWFVASIGVALTKVKVALTGTVLDVLTWQLLPILYLW